MGDIIIDPTYQVRKRTNGQKVAEYATAKENGDVFPPITIEKDTNKVIDGFTRVEAFKRVLSPDDKIEVIVKTFGSEAERIEYAASMNVKNGYSLDKWERGDVLTKLRNFGYNTEKIANVINWPVDTVNTYLGVRVRTIGSGKRKVRRDENAQGTRPNGVSVQGHERPLKGGMPHLRGKEVDESVFTNIRDHYVGQSAAFLARQILYRIEDGTLNEEDPKEIEILTKLRDEFTAYLSAKEKTA
jgi:hypothetical protein